MLRGSSHHILGDTHVQSIFGIDIILNFVSTVDWKVIPTRNQRQLEIDDTRENASWVRYDYAEGHIVYVDNTGIYRKIYYKKYETYIITEVFTNSAFRVQKDQVN